MLKKQTVWLLTMLSLMIVLSVYYIFSPVDTSDIAYPGNKEDNQEADGSVTDNESGDAEVTNITNRGKDELFAMLRMEIQSERSMSKERLNEIVKSSTATTEEKNEALSGMQAIDELSTKETILQERILSGTDKYEDVFVRYDNNKVHVHIRVNELSPEEANNIMQLVRNEFGEIPVEVNFDPFEG